jgi:F-type H+-transporting ATPase subunit alpha
VVTIFSGTQGYLDNIAVRDVVRYERDLLGHLRGHHQDLLDDITQNDRKVDGELKDKISSVLDAFTKDFA